MVMVIAILCIPTGEMMMMMMMMMMMIAQTPNSLLTAVF
jgi:hypothetical protein